MKTSEFPVWLAVPFELRGEARKAAGQLPDGQSAIGWNGVEKLFFARPGCDLEKVANWLPDKSRRAGGGDPEAEFRDVLLEAGLLVNGMPLMNGKRQRVATVEDKKGNKSGVYCGYDDRRPAGWFINYHRAASDKEVTNWKATGGEADPETRLHLRAGARQSQDEAERERASTHMKQTAAAKRLYERLPAVDPDHPYLVRKGITPTDELRQTNNGSMVVPFFDSQGEFKTLQYIPATGDKFLFKDAPKQGNFLVVGGALEIGKPILYAEGYATARSLNLATGRPVVMVIDAGNMVAVAKSLHQIYPGNSHLFLADFDHAKAENKGLLMATMAAEQVGGHVLYPDFTAHEKALGLTDFNDIHKSRGLDAVLSQVAPILNKITEDLPMQDDQKPIEPGVTPVPLPEAAAVPDKVVQPESAPKKPRSSRTAPKVPAKPAPAKADEAPVAKKARSSRVKPAEAGQAGLDASVVVPVSNVSSAPVDDQPAAPTDVAVKNSEPDSQPVEAAPIVPKEAYAVAESAPVPGLQSSGLATATESAPLTVVQPGEANELTLLERNELLDQGWTEDQLSDIPADQARSALLGGASNSEVAPAPADQPSDTDIENVDPGSAPQIDPRTQMVTEDSGTVPVEEPIIQSRQANAEGNDAVPQSEVDSIWVGPRRGVDEVPPPTALIDKDALLSRLDSKMQDDKSVLYTLDGEPAFVDRGMRLEMADGASQSDEKVLAALLTAAEYYRGRIELTGSEAFQRKAIGLIAQHQLNVAMKNPAQQMQLVEARKALQTESVVKDAINGESPPTYAAPLQPSTDTGVKPVADAPVTDATAQSQPVSAAPIEAPPVHEMADMQQAATLQMPELTNLPVVPNAQPAAAGEIPSPGAGFTKTIASEIHENHQTASKGVTGKVIASGDAPYRFDENNTQSTYIKLRTKAGTQTYWGKELAGLLRDTRITPGKVVTLQWLGKEPVVIRVPIRDDQGVIKRYDDKPTHRNQWSLSVLGGTTVRTGQDEGVKLAAYDANRFGHVQQALLARLRLDIPLPETPKDGLYWMTPDGQGSFKAGDALSTPRPTVDNKVAAQPVMSSWSPDGHLDMALVRGDGPYLQGVVRQDGQFQHVLVSLPNREDAPPMIFNALTPTGLAPIGSGNGINHSGGQPVSRENIAFRIDGDSAVRIGKLDKPAEVPPALHARLGFDERWRDDNTLPKSAPAAAPTAQPSEPRPA